MLLSSSLIFNLWVRNIPDKTKTQERSGMSENMNENTNKLINNH